MDSKNNFKVLYDSYLTIKKAEKPTSKMFLDFMNKSVCVSMKEEYSMIRKLFKNCVAPKCSDPSMVAISGGTEEEVWIIGEFMKVFTNFAKWHPTFMRDKIEAETEPADSLTSVQKAFRVCMFNAYNPLINTWLFVFKASDSIASSLEEIKGEARKNILENAKTLWTTGTVLKEFLKSDQDKLWEVLNSLRKYAIDLLEMKSREESTLDHHGDYEISNTSDDFYALIEAFFSDNYGRKFLEKNGGKRCKELAEVLKISQKDFSDYDANIEIQKLVKELGISVFERSKKLFGVEFPVILSNFNESFKVSNFSDKYPFFKLSNDRFVGFVTDSKRRKPKFFVCWSKRFDRPLWFIPYRQFLNKTGFIDEEVKGMLYSEADGVLYVPVAKNYIYYCNPYESSLMLSTEIRDDLFNIFIPEKGGLILLDRPSRKLIIFKTFNSVINNEPDESEEYGCEKFLSRSIKQVSSSGALFASSYKTFYIKKVETANGIETKEEARYCVEYMSRSVPYFCMDRKHLEVLVNQKESSLSEEEQLHLREVYYGTTKGYEGESSQLDLFSITPSFKSNRYYVKLNESTVTVLNVEHNIELTVQIKGKFSIYNLGHCVAIHDYEEGSMKTVSTYSESNKSSLIFSEKKISCQAILKEPSKYTLLECTRVLMPDSEYIFARRSNDRWYRYQRW